MTAEFSRAAAERRLGPAALDAIRKQVDTAPPLRTELREQLRAVFASATTARAITAAPPAARAA